ncbi:MAG: nucleoside monophosphate kinase [Candidatus Doudnabacteria bacterium]|nr:nucleoside monophosphate kinase [Candidatus Doudnabacteria bacterium]
MRKKRLGFELIILGDSASGKDTQALLLAKKYNVRLARSGEYFRKLRGYRYRHGAPAPSSLVIMFLNYYLKNLTWNRNTIFVGAARLKAEAQYLVKELNKRNRDFFVLYIKVPTTEIVKRSKLRSQRLEDRDIRLINSRIKYYKQQVSKTVDYYKRLRKLKFVNGKQTVSLVHKDILRAISDYQRSKRG